MTSALAQRLAATLSLLSTDRPPTDESVDALARATSDALAGADRAAVWLAHVAFTGAYPQGGVVTNSARQLSQRRGDDALRWLLTAWRSTYEASVDRPSQVVERSVLLDVTGPARSDLHTGIQRVVRKSAPHWADQGRVLAVAWDDSWASYRTLTPTEHRRVFDWEHHTPDRSTEGAGDPDLATTSLVTPWHCTIVLTEPSPTPACEPLTAMADAGANELVAIGYDVIPMVSAELVNRGLPDQFLRYLQVILRTTKVAAISETAAEEFRGCSDAFAAHGVTGPEITAVALPAPSPTGPSTPPSGRPEVLVVGSYEPRKNHLAVLHAAELLWREGLDFELHFVGGMSWVHDIHREVHRLVQAGYPLVTHFKLSDDALDARFRSARFTMFVSLHEGYGLPVVESLAAGTPALVSSTGSVGEISVGGGCVRVSPQDDHAIVTEMRRLLTDDAAIADLRAEIDRRPHSDWAGYASDVWDVLVNDGAPAR